MTENKHIETLLKNLQNGLKTHSVKELNDAIIIAINNREDKKADIDYVLNLVADAYNISLKTLMSNGRGKIVDAKQTAYCLLHINLGLSIRYIAKRIFFNWHTSVFTGIKRLKSANPKVKSDAEFINVYDALQLQVEKYILHKNESE